MKMVQAWLAGLVILLGAMVKAAPVCYWNGEKVASPEALGAVAYNQSVSILVTFDADAVANGTLVEVKGGGGNASTQNVYKRLAVTLDADGLKGIVAGKNGTDVTLGGSALLTTLPKGMVRVAMVIETSSGTSIAPRAIATGGSQRSGSDFNFDNVAGSSSGSSWSENAPFNLWSVADSVTSVEVYPGVAWKADEMAQQVVEPAEPEQVLEVVGTVTYPEEAPDKLCFKGGTLVIPQGVTVETLRLTADSGEGSVLVKGALIGRDTAEPGIPAFELPPMIEVADGGTLQMDGRISGVVSISGTVTLSAATAKGTLTLDTIEVEEGARVTIPQGCLEVYAAPKFAAEEGAAFRRWVAPGFQVRLY